VAKQEIDIEAMMGKPADKLTQGDMLAALDQAAAGISDPAIKKSVGALKAQMAGHTHDYGNDGQCKNCLHHRDPA